MNYIILILWLLTNSVYAEINSISSTGSIIIDGNDITKTNSIQDAGKIITISKDSEYFDKIETHGAFSVIYKQGKSSVEIRGDENIVPLIVTKIVNNSLFLSAEKSYSTQSPLIITVYSPELTAINAQGSGEITLNDIANENFAIRLNGSAQLKALGKTIHLSIATVGSGEVNTGELQAQDVIVNNQGAGEVVVLATDSLKAQLTGSGDIVYRGNPKTVAKEIFGSGAIVAQ